MSWAAVGVFSVSVAWAQGELGPISPIGEIPTQTEIATPKLECDASGTALLLWSVGATPETSTIYVSHSEDVGETWSAPGMVGLGRSSGLVTDDAGRWMLVSAHLGRGFIWASQDGGQSWGSHEEIDQHSQSATRVDYPPRVAVNAAGALGIVWASTDAGTKVMHAMVSTDWGQTWSSPATVVGPAEQFSAYGILADSVRNEWHIVYIHADGRTRATHSTDGSVWLTPQTVLPGHLGLDFPTYFDAWSGTGGDSIVTVAYTYCDNDMGGRILHAMHSADGWRTITHNLLGDPFGYCPGGFYPELPGVATDDHGGWMAAFIEENKIHTFWSRGGNVWNERRQGGSDLIPQHNRMLLCTDGNDTWRLVWPYETTGGMAFATATMTTFLPIRWITTFTLLSTLVALSVYLFHRRHVKHDRCIEVAHDDIAS